MSKPIVLASDTDASCSVVTSTTTLAHQGRRGGVHLMTASPHTRRSHKSRSALRDSSRKECDHGPRNQTGRAAGAANDRPSLTRGAPASIHAGYYLLFN